MSKLYRRGMVHPSPPLILYLLSFLLPATVLTLTVPLSPEDKEAVAYLILYPSYSSSSSHQNTRRKSKGLYHVNHLPLFHCNCFNCYTSYWARWNSSPNVQIIDKIIEAFDEDSFSPTWNDKINKSSEWTRSEFAIDSVSSESESVGESSCITISNSVDVSEESDEIENEEKSTVRRFMSFIRRRIWNACWLCINFRNKK
ncbi:uncharacterized protein [Cicer arietinum]|uniref:Uncharacterized protein LOC101515472 n=1 Tax=Cicer arietinum TaxID=3827 RepID=A0A1S2YNU5_CICAR|nr:uncharacterized protein LOC101515472 [Cicer arietinum]